MIASKFPPSTKPRPDTYPTIVKEAGEGERKTPVSYEALDLTSDANRLLLTNMLLAALICRFTGYVELLCGWKNPDFKDGDVHLPTMGTTVEFAAYLEGCMLVSDPDKIVEDKVTGKAMPSRYKQYTSVQSHQHQKTIPKFVSRRKFLRFISSLGKSESSIGFSRVREYIKQTMTPNKKLARLGLFRMMMQCASDCGDLQMPDNLKFIVNKALTDVQCVIPYFIDEITLDQVYLGWGAQQGLVLLKLQLNSDMMKRFVLVNMKLNELLMKADAKLLKAMGYERVTKEGETFIASLYSGRRFSMNDTEHFLCKLWLAVIHSHQSRNVAKVKSQHNHHTWPLLQVCPWEEHLSPLMTSIWKAFKDVRRKFPYPESLQFYFMDGMKEIETSRTKARKNGSIPS